VDVAGITGDHLFSPETAEQRSLQEAHAGWHVPGRTVVVIFEVAPSRILSIQHTLQPHRKRRHRHLNEKTGVIDDLRERSRQNKEAASVVLACGSR
jgi:hypothetical protein